MLVLILVRGILCVWVIEVVMLCCILYVGFGLLIWIGKVCLYLFKVVVLVEVISLW